MNELCCVAQPETKPLKSPCFTCLMLFIERCEVCLFTTVYVYFPHQWHSHGEKLVIHVVWFLLELCIVKSCVNNKVSYFLLCVFVLFYAYLCVRYMLVLTIFKILSKNSKLLVILCTTCKYFKFIHCVWTVWQDYNNGKWILFN